MKNDIVDPYAVGTHPTTSFQATPVPTPTSVAHQPQAYNHHLARTVLLAAPRTESSSPVTVVHNTATRHGHIATWAAALIIFFIATFIAGGIYTATKYHQHLASTTPGGTTSTKQISKIQSNITDLQRQLATIAPNSDQYKTIQTQISALTAQLTAIQQQVATATGGTPGPQGPKGDQGTPGAAGPQGEQGAPGTASQKGDKGDPGAAGPAGATGPQGATGAQGPTGATGSKGDTGAIGPTGTAGADGESAYGLALDSGFSGTLTDWLNSLVGPQGATGAQGPTGATGAKGDKGDTGDIGAAGPTGDTGATGTAGTNGTNGESAYQLAIDEGFTGDEAMWLLSLVGPQGIQGVEGPKGDTGATGATGAKGNQGDTGAAGTNGADGESAYGLALDSGFSGTLTDWLNSLVGPQGPTGATGATGPKGDTGDTGATGAKGDKGDTGDQGIQGEKGDQGNPGATQDLSGYVAYADLASLTADIATTQTITAQEGLVLDSAGTMKIYDDGSIMDVQALGGIAFDSGGTDIINFNTDSTITADGLSRASAGALALNALSGVTLQYNASTKLAVTSNGITITGGGTFSDYLVLSNLVAGSLTYTNSSNQLVSLGVGAAGQCVTSTGTAPAWNACSTFGTVTSFTAPNATGSINYETYVVTLDNSLGTVTKSNTVSCGAGQVLVCGLKLNDRVQLTKDTSGNWYIISGGDGTGVYVKGDVLYNKWIVVGAGGYIAGTDVATPAFQNGWTYDTVNSRKTEFELTNKTLWANMAVAGASATGGGMFTLPAGYRPALPTDTIFQFNGNFAYNVSAGAITSYASGQLGTGVYYGLFIIPAQ